MDDILLRLSLAALFGALVGVERQWRHKNAGIKTNTLVALGAAGFAMMSNSFGPANHNPAQLAAAVVTGIGFIGAGVIIHRGGSVQGVNTAATLWANASAGVAVGLGYLRIGTTLTVTILIVQFLTRYAARAINRHARGSAPPQRFEIGVHCDPAALSVVEETWSTFAESRHLTPTGRSMSRRIDGLLWQTEFTCAILELSDLTPLEHRMLGIHGVTRVELRQTTAEDENQDQ
jgi:uncharacterized membrane protein YhiD involved in acid resistance